MFHLSLLEPKNVNYVYVDEATNNVYLLIPLVGGASIGLDNTCRTVLEMQKFFGKDHNAAINRSSALDQLNRYRDAINTDLELSATYRSATNDRVRQQKTQRLEQINHYINVLERLNASRQFERLSTALPSYPPAIHSLFLQGFSNLHFMLLSPEHIDTFVRTTSSTFSIARKRYRYEVNFPPGLSQTLNLTFRELVIGQRQAENLRDVLKRAVVNSLDATFIPRPHEITEEIFQAMIIELRNQFQSMFHQQIGLERINGARDADAIVTKDNIEGICALDPSDDSYDGYIDGILNSCVNENIWASISGTPSPFNLITDPTQHREKLSIIVQFFLAQVNIYCVSNNISTVNFGTLLDNDQLKRANIAQLILRHMADGTCPENGLFEFINNNYQFFGMHAPLTTIQKDFIRAKFRSDYATIQDSPHFDEFIVFTPEKQVSNGTPRAVYHQGRLCINFADFIIAGHRREDIAGFFTNKQNQFRTLTTTRLPHFNQSVVGSFDFDENAAIELLNSRQVEKLAGLLTTTIINPDGSISDKQLFQSLPQSIINQLVRHEHWNDLRRATIAKMGTAEKIEQFNLKYQYTDLKPSILLSAEEIMCIENEFISLNGDRIETADRGSVDSIATMLSVILISDEVVEVDLNMAGGYVVTTTQNQIEEINTVIENNRTLFCLPACLEARVFAAVMHRFGRNSQEYLRLRALDSNKPEKLNLAFNLLNIKAKFDHIDPRDAYIFIVESGQQEPILTICYSYKSTIEEEITTEEFLKLNEVQTAQDSETIQDNEATQQEEKLIFSSISSDTKPSSPKKCRQPTKNNKLSSAIVSGLITFLVLLSIVTIIIHSAIILFLARMIGLANTSINLGLIYTVVTPIIMLLSIAVSIIKLTASTSPARTKTKSDIKKIDNNFDPNPYKAIGILREQIHQAPILFSHKRQQMIAQPVAITADQEKRPVVHRIH